MPSSTASAPKKKMLLNEFYDVRSRSRVKVDMEDISIRTIDGSKYRDGKPRYQAVGDMGEGVLVYKFISAADKPRYES